jgi:hypothetical protein
LSILKFLGFEQIFKNALTGCEFHPAALFSSKLYTDVCSDDGWW